MKKKKRVTKRAAVTISLIAVVVIAGAVFIATRVQVARAESNRMQTPQLISLEKTDITRTVSVSGVVESASVKNIYSTQSYPVKEIHVKVGDPVKAGDLLAELDMSRLLSDISQTEINLRSAVASAAEELRSNANSVSNAQTSLESSQLSLARQQLNVQNAQRDLREAQQKMSEEFDSYSYDKVIDDASLALDRRTADLEKAQEDLEKAINDFDDYSYQNAIADAKNSLERRKVDLADAEKKLTSEKNDKTNTLGSYENAVSDAGRNIDRKRSDYYTATDDYYYALGDYNNALGSTPEAEAAAWAKVENARKALTAADRAVTDAETAYDRAVADLQRARENTVDSAQSSVDNAKNAVSDAQTAYERTVTNLERAKSDAVDAASNKLTSAQNAYDDAQRSYEKALNDKIRAINDSKDNVANRLESANRTYSDSLRQLESSQNSVRSAENSYEQAESRPASQGSNVEIQELNLKKLYDQLAEGKIFATSDGVITEVNAKVGASPSGILFVIEDTDNLHVSARVREHSISAVFLGQAATITTDATGDKVYEGTVSYISPRAVSAAGSTSVEFEVRADLNSPDAVIRIGMNAFLNIVTEQKSGVYAVPNSVIVTNERGSFVYTIENGERQEVPVALGIKTLVNSEISGDGLYDGIELIVDPEGLLASPDSRTFPPMWGR